MAGNPIPTLDGQVVECFECDLNDSPFYSPNKRVIFINGMANSGTDHRDSALALSHLQMCPVIGVYNKTEGAGWDLLQCVADKWQFNAPIPADFSAAIAKFFELAPEAGDRRTRVEIMRGLLSRNAAAVSMFDLLLRRDLQRAPIFAHSQGNLILSNALQAVAAAAGPGAIAGREIHSFGSPAHTWPSGILRKDYAFTFDPVGWLSLSFDLEVSKIGVPKGSSWYWPFAHGFATYVDNDPEFFVNRRRWGGLGVTLALDEEALAEDLLALGRNMPRVKSVFSWLAQNLPADSDDVAVLYVESIKDLHASSGVRLALKACPGLIPLLITCMATGWVGGDEEDAIEWLESL
jgi:hypothetical protein